MVRAGRFSRSAVLGMAAACAGAACGGKTAADASSGAAGRGGSGGALSSGVPAGSGGVSPVGASGGGTAIGGHMATGGGPAVGGGVATGGAAGKIGPCCWLDSGCAAGETCVGGACWPPDAGCWSDEDCGDGFRCEGAFACSCCVACDCAGDSAGKCVRDVCTIVEDPPPDPADTCQDLGRLALGDPLLDDDGGDGRLSPGEGAFLTVTLHETAGYGFNWYPGVRIETENHLVSASEPDWTYALGACQSLGYTTRLETSLDLPPGIAIVLTARAASLNVHCPSAPALEIPITIAP